MKKYLRAMLMSFTMFTAVPCPFHMWDDEARPLMTLFLPVVGIFVGGLWTLAAFVLRWLSVSALPETSPLESALEWMHLWV